MSNRKILVLLTMVLSVLFVEITLASALSDWLHSWMKDASCCYTNNCCFTIKATDLTHLGNDRYIINVTGQTVTAKGFTPDGEYWRCACDQMTNGSWGPADVRANTRCLFTPKAGS